MKPLLAAALSFAAAPAPAAETNPQPFLEPQQRVEIAPGRTLNLVCMGAGKHTLLLEAGGSDWSAVWATVLPKLARSSRACAYDRAGLGFSEAAREPRSPIAIVEDMRRLVESAKLKRPLILVGHSLGGFHVKLYAALYPEDVAGMVLIDPAEERVWDRTRSWAIERYGARIAAKSELTDQGFLAGLIERYRGCAAKPGGVDPQSADYRRCADPPRPALGPAINAERQKIHATPAYQAAQASEIAASVYGDDRSDEPYAHLFRVGVFGAKPLIVLTHDEPPSAAALDRLSKEQGLLLHRETARLSRRGRHRVVQNSGHYIQLDQPDALTGAIEEVLAELKTVSR